MHSRTKTAGNERNHKLSFVYELTTVNCIKIELNPRKEKLLQYFLYNTTQYNAY